MKKYMFLSFTCLLVAGLIAFSQVRKQQEELADHLAPSILRFHILADSDSRQDQQVKLEVRSLILDYMQEKMDPDAKKPEITAWLTENTGSLETMMNQYLAEQGFSYQARLQLTNCYFPARAYGTFTFPAGYYDAARIVLGKGRGRNWWCVLYPRFCFVDAVCSSIPEESLAFLQQNLNQDDFLALEDNRPEIKIRFFLLPDLYSE